MGAWRKSVKIEYLDRPGMSQCNEQAEWNWNKAVLVLLRGESLQRFLRLVSLITEGT